MRTGTLLDFPSMAKRRHYVSDDWDLKFYSDLNFKLDATEVMMKNNVIILSIIHFNVTVKNMLVTINKRFIIHVKH
jgi:hypothetical protein